MNLTNHINELQLRAENLALESDSLRDQLELKRAELAALEQRYSTVRKQKDQAIGAVRAVEQLQKDFDAAAQAAKANEQADVVE